MDALWYDILLLTLISIPCLFCFSSHKYALYEFGTGGVFLIAFSYSVLFEKPLAITDTIVETFSWTVILTLFVCAVRDVIRTGQHKQTR